ncbi:MAG TPA: hypothetical protein VJU58_10095 [Microbacterium sp.]|nr:hypothetical protein [Microbacterium sp.]
MPVGPRIGPAVGPRIGVALGVSEDPISAGGAPVLPGVTRDASRGIYCPATAAEWTTVLTAAGDATGGPSAVYTFQEASGNLVDQVGTFTCAVSGTGLAYQVTESGWTRKAITTTEGASGLFLNTDAGLPDISTNSCLVLTYVRTVSSISRRSIFGLGPAGSRCSAERELTTGVPVIMDFPQQASGTIDPSGVVRPWWLQINQAASFAGILTDQEKIVPSWSGTAAGKRLTYGILQNNCSTAAYLYSAVFFNAAAEKSLAAIKSISQTLGWTIPWT